jgi:RNA recognition motif. (a.k.a. RRM, RBD, or RNP domain)
MKPIFCGNLDYDVRYSEIERAFSRYGKIERIDMKSGRLILSYCVHHFISNWICGVTFSIDEIKLYFIGVATYQIFFFAKKVVVTCFLGIHSVF